MLVREVAATCGDAQTRVRARVDARTDESSNRYRCDRAPCESGCQRASSSAATVSALAASAFFDQASQEVRFYVDVSGSSVGASIGKATLHYRFRADSRTDEPLQTFTAHRAEIEAAVRRRVAAGSLQPVMLRENDLPRY